MILLVWNFIRVLINLSCREWKEKVDQVEDIEMDTLEFTEKKTFYFNAELSSPLTGDEELTMIHPLVAVSFKILQQYHASYTLYLTGYAAYGKRRPCAHVAVNFQSGRSDLSRAKEYLLDRKSNGHNVRWHFARLFIN